MHRYGPWNENSLPHRLKNGLILVFTVGYVDWYKSDEGPSEQRPKRYENYNKDEDDNLHLSNMNK